MRKSRKVLRAAAMLLMVVTVVLLPLLRPIAMTGRLHPSAPLPESAGAVNAVRPAGTAGPDFGLLAGTARLHAPVGPPDGVIYLFSDMAGWDATEEGIARALADDGTAVVGIDLATLLPALERAAGTCLYLVADIERSSHQIERAGGSATFRGPVLAGRGVGGAMVIDLLAQTPAATLGGAVAIDPGFGVPLSRPLCTPAARTVSLAGARYALPAGPPPAPLSIVLSSASGSDSLARVGLLDRGGTTFDERRSGVPPVEATLSAVTAMLRHDRTRDPGLPVTDVPAAPMHDAVAVILSGDGGWRDLDRTIAGELAAEGVPSIGLDSLRYFWTPRTPAEVARDLASIIASATRRYGVGRVILAGYSFGANVLPAVFPALPRDVRDRVARIVLLGPGREADWEITVAGWLGSSGPGATPTGPAIAALPAARTLCVSGRDDREAGCPARDANGMTVIETAGGHHFDGDYPALASLILQGLDRKGDTP